uniref:RNA-directed DNA polymerase n=1 Tax=Plectus sambesii TaxID=2011161 RepID=A0A914VK21_9BILA
MQRLARRFFWWPGLDADIDQLVSDCDPCIQRLPDPTPVPPQPWPRANRPWKRIHMDFAGPFLGSMWLIVIDAYSRWPEVVEMQVGHMTTSSVIFTLSTMFSRYGFAETLVSDNGRQFTSDAFAEWCRSHGVIHKLTTPYHPSSNGLAKRFVGTFKQAMLKGGEEEEEKKVCLLKFLQRYRLTPHPATDQAPAELFLGRTPRSQFDLLFPTDLLAAEKTKEKDKLHYSHDAKEKKIAIGAAVLIRRYKGGQPAGWVRGTVVGRQGSVVWEVKPSDRDEVWRRHSDQLRLARTVDDPEPQDDSDLPYDSTTQHNPEPQHDQAPHYDPEPLYYSAPLFDPVPPNDSDRQVDLTVPELQSALLDAPAAAEQASSPPSANPLSEPPKDSEPLLSTPSVTTQQMLRRSTRVRRPAQVFAPE